MVKADLTLQQQRRVKKRHDLLAGDAADAAIVVACFGREALVAKTPGQWMRATMRQSVSALVAGDRVVLSSDASPVITACLPRTNVIARDSRFGRVKVLAANVTQLVIVLALVPETPDLQLDSYLVLAEKLRLSVTLVVNKMDLAKDSNALRARYQCYTEMGYRVCYVHEALPDLQAQLMAVLRGQVSIFVGQSGVGKSSLINCVLGESVAEVGQIAKTLGRHTTSNAHYYFLPEGALIDSPGVREFQLNNYDAMDLLHGFRELAACQGRCRFKNCRHDGEPGCAVQALCDSGKVQPARLASFQALLARLSAG